MEDSGLYRLYRLAQLDRELHGLRRRAKALDVGRDEKAALRRITTEAGPAIERVRFGQREIDRLLTSADERRAKADDFERRLYAGEFVNPREVEDYNKEVKLLREKAEQEEQAAYDHEAALGPHLNQARAAKREVKRLKALILQKKEAALVEHGALEKDFEAMRGRRPELTAPIPKPLLDSYEALRGRIGDPALSLVTEDLRCGECGVPVPERVREAVARDEALTCENCLRILFWVVPTE
jgi:predicted  nucleic acid-binding Zn-ribbon protein